jgi:uncharacterized protein YjiS (DUF1127 family)
MQQFENFSSRSRQMTFYAQSRVTTAEVLAGLEGLSLGALFARAMLWIEQRQTRNALNALSDRELADIGLARAEIEAVVQGCHH